MQVAVETEKRSIITGHWPLYAAPLWETFCWCYYESI